jgi:hypothetical protein
MIYVLIGGVGYALFLVFAVAMCKAAAKTSRAIEMEQVRSDLDDELSKKLEKELRELSR